MPLGRVRDYGDARYAGCECETEDVECALREALDGGFDFILAPLSLPRDAHTPPSVPRPPIPRADFLLSSSAWSSQVVGRVSAWIQPDSDDALLRTHSEQALRAELAWAAHLSLQARQAVCANQPYETAATWQLRSLSLCAVD
jgi:protein arginine N-methyltransferase 5